jgi:adenine specific DNA methylase Mod
MPTLNWIGKEAVEKHHLEIPYRLLEYDDELSTGDKEAGNLLIQGDNLHALKALLPYYAGKVKCIYIDPPYNTGEEKWRYNDNVNAPEIRKWFNEVVGNEEEDFTRHDKWLCMMYPRLQLLKKLLDKDGVIFISIEDTELSRLKLICDEIFTPKAFVTCLVWEKKKKGTHLDKKRISVKEYILVYSKRPQTFNGLIGEVQSKRETYPCINPGNSRSSRIIPKGTLSNFKEKDHKLIRGERISVGNMYLTLLSDLIIENGRLKEDVEVEAEWRYTQASLNKYAEDDTLYFTRDLYLRRIVEEPRYKKLKDLLQRVEYGYIDDLKSKLITELLKNEKDEIIVNDLLSKIDSYENQHHMNIDDIANLNSSGWGSNEDGDEELRQLFGRKVFDFPKPTKLLLKLVASTRFNEGIFLDSFAGTGTFGHSIMRLNKLTNTNRKYILVELEEYIAKKVTAERLKRVINGYEVQKQNGTTEKVEGLGGGFRYCKLSEPLFDQYGNVREGVTFNQLAYHIFFSETGVPLKENAKLDTPLIGKYKGTAYYLLFNGILGDKTVNGGNVLTSKVLESLPKYKGDKIIFGMACRLSAARLKNENISFRQIPVEIKIS